MAAQRNLMHVMNYGTAFYGTAALQTWSMGMTVPMTFWSAVARAAGGGKAANLSPAPKTPVIDVAPDPVPVPEPMPDPAPEPAVEPVAAPEPELVVESAPEPVSAVLPAPEPTPEPTPEPLPAGPSPHLLDAPRGGKPDDLTVISGVGEKLAETLNEFGIFHFDQIAMLDEVGVNWLNEQQPGFKALVKRFDLVGQAKVLADG